MGSSGAWIYHPGTTTTTQTGPITMNGTTYPGSTEVTVSPGYWTYEPRDVEIMYSGEQHFYLGEFLATSGAVAPFTLTLAAATGVAASSFATPIAGALAASGVLICAEGVIFLSAIHPEWPSTIVISPETKFPPGLVETYSQKGWGQFGRPYNPPMQGR